MTNAVSSALAERRGGQVDPRTFVKNNAASLSAMLPTHLQEKGDAWARQVAGSLYRGQMSNGRDYDLVVAAQNNPDAFMIALRQAASLGLTPGTDEYYLTPRKVAGRLEILGIVGYQGYVELMYRAGAVSSVIVELVYEEDGFDYMPGRDEVPMHKIDWKLPDRGKPWLVYAYARMVSGSVSKVIVMNEAEIERYKERSASAKFGKSSPWTTDPGAMWMKTAVRQLRKWVPTSSEHLASQIRAAREGQHGVSVAVPAVPGQAPIPSGHQVVIDDHDEVVEGELVPEGTPAEPVTDPAAEQAAEPAAEPEQAPADDVLISKAEKGALVRLFGKAGLNTPESRHGAIKSNLGLEVASLDQLTVEQAERLVKVLNVLVGRREAQAREPEDIPLPTDEPA